MKKSTKNTLLLFSMVCMSSKAFADFRDPQMGERYRRDHKNMDICAEIKADLSEVETKFYNMENLVRSANQKIQTQRNKVGTKSDALNSTQTNFNRAKTHHANLVQKQANKPKIVAQMNQIIADSAGKISAAKTAVDEAERYRKKKCRRGFGLGSLSSSCSKAEKAKKQKQAVYDREVAQKANAKKTIAELRTIDQRVTRSQKALNVAKKAYNTEKNATPTFAQLETKLNNMIANRDKDFKGYDKLERQYGRLEIRTEKCINMQFEARKAPVFRDALLTFASNNGAGCDQYSSMMYNAKGKAQKQGLKEAYDLVCESNVLERVVEIEVPVEVPVEVRVDVPGQCPELPPVVTPVCEDNGSGDNGGYEPEYVEETISTNYSSNENGNTYPPRVYESRGVPKLVKVLEDRGAVAIKLDIAKIDMEHGYDYIKILDENDNVVYDQTGYASQESGKEGQIQNARGEVPVTNFSTGWVQGSTLKVYMYTDGATNLSGFEINNFQVRYER